MVDITYRKPREMLGEFLAKQGFPESSWNTHFNQDQKEYWYIKADAVIAFIKKHGI